MVHRERTSCFKGDTKALGFRFHVYVKCQYKERVPLKPVSSRRDSRVSTSTLLAFS